MKEFSTEVQNVLQALQQYSGGRLRKIQDVGVLLDVAAQFNLAEQMNALIFAGSAVWKLYRSLHRTAAQEHAAVALESEIRHWMEQMRGAIRQIVHDKGPEVVWQRFQRVYFDAPGAARNLIDLAYDLHWLHQLQRENRRRDETM